MGLLDHILKIQQKRHGLLQKADMLLSQNDTLLKYSEKIIFIFNEFHRIIHELGLSKAGVFVPRGDVYKMIFSHGYDHETVLMSHSSSDFWQGTISGQEWNYFSGAALAPFYQFFSDQEKETLETLSIKPFLSEKGLMCYFLSTNCSHNTHSLESCFNDKISDLKRLADLSRNFINDHIAVNEENLLTIEKIENGFEHTVPVLFSVSFKQLCDIVKPYLSSVEAAILNDEIFYQLNSIAHAEDICRIDHFSLKYAFFSKTYSFDSFKQSVISVLSNFIEQSYINHISFTQINNAASINDVKKFFILE